MKPETGSIQSPVEGASPPTSLLPSPWAHTIHKPVFIAFLTCFALEWVGLLLRMTQDRAWINVMFWSLAAAVSLVGLGRRLAGQNVLMSALLISAISFCVGVVSEKTAIPFGPRVYTDALGGKTLGVPCSMPLMWIAVVICGRGVARLILRPWRKTTYYGFWVIGLACLVAVWLDLGLEPFAARVKRYWLWQVSPGVLNWYSAPWTNFLGWLVTTLGILGFTTPWLINKQPVKQATDYHPLVIWLLLNVYFATGNALNQMWLAVGASLIGCVVAAIYAVRGARW